MAQNPKILAIEKTNIIKPNQLLNLTKDVWYNIAGMVPAKGVNTSKNSKASNKKGHPTYTRYLTKEEVFAIEQMFRRMKQRGTPFNLLVTIRIDGVMLNKQPYENAISHIQKIFRKQQSKFFAIGVYERCAFDEKNPKNHQLHLHIVLHAPFGMEKHLTAFANSKRILDKTKYDIRAADDSVFNYIVKQRRWYPKDNLQKFSRRALFRKDRWQRGDFIPGNRMVMSYDLKVLFPEYTKVKRDHCTPRPNSQQKKNLKSLMAHFPKLTLRHFGGLGRALMYHASNYNLAEE